MFKWLFFTLLAICPFCVQAATGYSDVNTDQLKQLITTMPNLIIVDARTPEHDNGQRIEGAIVLPYTSEDATVKAILPKKDAPIVVYCWSATCPISQRMVDRLVALGYTKLYKYPDGLSVWIDEMGPIETVEK